MGRKQRKRKSQTSVNYLLLISIDNWVSIQLGPVWEICRIWFRMTLQRGGRQSINANMVCSLLNACGSSSKPGMQAEIGQQSEPKCKVMPLSVNLTSVKEAIPTAATEDRRHGVVLKPLLCPAFLQWHFKSRILHFIRDLCISKQFPTNFLSNMQIVWWSCFDQWWKWIENRENEQSGDLTSFLMSCCSACNHRHKRYLQRPGLGSCLCPESIRGAGHP